LSGDNVILDSGATLQAIGGEIELNAGDAMAPGTIPTPAGMTLIPACSSCAITLYPGSTITTSERHQAGQLILRAPALQSSNDVAINVPATGISGIGANVVECRSGDHRTGHEFATNNDFIGTTCRTMSRPRPRFLTAASPVIQQRLAPSPAQFSSATPPLVEVGVDLIDPVNENLDAARDRFVALQHRHQHGNSASHQSRGPCGRFSDPTRR
jgi:hypothetical protein